MRLLLHSMRLESQLRPFDPARHYEPVQGMAQLRRQTGRASQDPRTKRYLSINEIAALGEAMTAALAEGRSRTGIAAVRALLLSGCRRHEILALPWAWFDTSARCIRFGDTKSGAQIRPIGLAAVQFL